MSKNIIKLSRIRNIIIALIAVIMILGIYIKVQAVDAGNGTLNPIYKPIWEKVSSTLNTADNSLSIVLKGSAILETPITNDGVTVQYSTTVTSTLTADDIWVYIDGELDGDADKDGILETGETPSITKTLTPPADTTAVESVTYTLKLSGFEESVRQSGKSFLEWSGNVKLKIAGRGQDSSTYNAGILVDAYGNDNMMEIDTTGTWVDVTFEETARESNDTTSTSTMFADFIKPEITYKSSDTTINHGVAAADEWVELIFDVTDKYFNEATFTKDDLIVNLTDTNTNISANITKTLTKVEDLYHNINGTSKKIGERYKLTITGLDKGDGETYSGPMSITIPNGKITDKSGNSSLATTTTFLVGVDEPGGSGTGDIVDVVDPIWIVENIQKNKGTTPAASTVTMHLIAKDKYYLSNTLTAANVAEKITVTVDGQAPNTAYVTRSISASEYVKLDASGNYITATQAEAIGVRYTLTLSNWGDVEHTFTDANSSPSEEKSYIDYSGETIITIAAETITDQYTNKSNEQEFNLGQVDFINPVIEKISSTIGTDKETIVFDVLDKYLDTTDNITESEITVKVDGETASDITKQITDIREIKEGSRTVGKRYTLELSGFEGTTTHTSAAVSGSTVTFKEWSGTVSIDISADAVKDSTNNKNVATTLTGDHIDFSAPVIEKVSSTKGTGTETIIFNVIDKYLDTTDAVEIDEITVYVDGEETSLTGTLTKIKDFTYTTTPTTGYSSKTLTVGQQYQLVISNFSGAGKESIIADDGSTVTFDEYSGTISIKIDAEAVKDYGKGPTFATAADPNKSAEKNIVGDHIDFIKPVIEKISSSVNTTAKSETIIFNVIDKYLKTSDAITSSEITVYIDGEVVTVDYTNASTTGVDGTLTKIRDYTYTTVNGNTLTVGQQYQLVLSNFEEPTLQTGKIYKEWSGTASIKVAVDAATDTSNNGVVETTLTGDHVDFIAPVIEKVSSTIDTTAKTETIIFRVIDKYLETSDAVELGEITVYVDGEEASDITKEIKSKTNIEHNGRVVGQEYTLELSGFEKTALKTGKIFKEWSGTVSIKVAADAVKDTSNNKNIDTTLTGDHVDFIQPTVEKVSTNKDTTAKTETIIFNVIDKYLDTSDPVAASEITVYIDGEPVTVDYTDSSSTGLNGVLTKIEDFTYTTVPATGYTSKTLTVGQQYQLVLSNFEDGTTKTSTTVDLDDGSAVDFKQWSGTVSIKVAANAVKDTSNNKNIDTTITGEHIDFIKPVIEKVSSTKGTGTETIIFNVIDKYLDTTDSVATSEITVYVDGEETALTGTLTKVRDYTYTTTPATGFTSQTLTVGQQYQLVISDFTGADKTSAASDDGSTVTFDEYSGTITLKIAQDAVKDTSNNKNIETPIAGDHIDFIKPVIQEVTSTKGSGTETIIFNVIDKYLDTSDAIATNEITVYVDGEPVTVDYTNASATGLDGTFAKVRDYTYTTAAGDTLTVGQQYQLVLSNFDQTNRNAKEYIDWSGTVTVEITSAAVKDTSNNNLDTNVTARTITGDYVDFIKPDIEYTHVISDVNTTNKKYTMTFSITDKYYTSGVLQLSDLTILMQNGQKDANGNLIIYDLQDELASGSIELTSTAITADVNLTNATTGAVEAVTGHTIGHTYTLTISNLEQSEIVGDLKTANYSGIVTVAIAADKIADRVPNKNNSTTLTSGINISGGTTSGEEVEVDVVDPIWEKVTSSANAVEQTATIKLQGTDTYLNASDTDASTLTTDEIEIYINGTKNTSITPNISAVTKLEEERNIFGTTSTETVQYGVEYTITLTGFVQNANQVKIKILEDAIKDETGNGNKETEFIVYNCLELTSSETAATSGFLGETSIERQNIQQVVFVNNLDAAPITIAADGTITLGTNCWDASAQGDNSILAWYSETAAPYTVYIGSDGEIFANQDSSYLFSYIGYAESCTETTTISNLAALNTNSVTDMAYMFQYCGYRSMSTLDLGAFDTADVTDMEGMFAYTGYTAMTTFNIGTAFNTSSVTNMKAMFEYFGYTALGSLSLGNNFITDSVTDMSKMFNRTGYLLMSTFNLGGNFNTSSVTDMSEMFQQCGYTKLSTFDLGDEFYTSSVTNMNSMFYNFGNKLLTTLDLGEHFDTINVTNMRNMFRGITKLTTLELGENFNTRNVQDMEHMFGYLYAMEYLDLGDKFYTTSATNMNRMFRLSGKLKVLDLGPAFTRIADGTITYDGSIINAYEKMFADAGTSNCVIYAPESIYNDMTHFKLNTNSTTTIEYVHGTINPVYKPEWEKVSTSVDVANKEITVTFKGYANETFTNGTYTGDYLSTITSSITAGNDTSNLLVVKVDGEIAEEITQTVTAVSVTGNEVQYTIKLSGFEETTRQTAKDKNFLEWSGNIAIQPVKGTLVDIYGNKNMIAIDGSDGKWTDIEFRDVTQEGSTDATVSGNWTDLEDNNTDAVANATMFTDYIKPEFTYVSSATNPDIDGDPDNRVTIVFDVTDKYFASTTLATNTNGSLITVIVDEDSDANTAITKTLTKVDDLYYTVNGVTDHKVGERYQLVIDGLESSDGIGYSGPLTLSFPAEVISDLSGNKSDLMSITMGINEPDGTTGTETIVDVVNPVWSYADSEIDRTNKEVNVYIIGSDKYYLSNTLTNNNITVYVDGSATTVDTDRDGTADANVTSIRKTLTDITDDVDATRLAELIAGAGLTDSMTADNNLTAVGVIYKLTLYNFGTISGETKVVLPAGTITDESGNINTDTTIEVGNVTWTETGDDPTTPRYPAFRNDIVDFIKPVITYTYSTVVGEENPDIDYTNKIVTVKFTVTDKYLLESDLIETDASGNQIPKNITILVDDETVYVNDGDSSTTDTREVTTSITATNIANGIEYTLVVEDLQKYERLDNDGYTYSGPMQIVFNANAIDDTSGNKNDAKTITLDTEYDDVVDVVDPIIKITEVNGLNLSSQNANNKINRTDNVDTVEVVLRGEDKYLVAQGHADRELLVNNANNIKVKVKKHDGTIIQNSARIQKVVEKTLDREQYVQYKVTLSTFGTDQGLVSLIIPANMIKDTSGNGNIETEVFVGNTDWSLDGSGYTAFNNSIVDFTDPTWNYATSSITRDRDNETGTVTVKILGHDDYFFRDKLALTAENIQVYIGTQLAGSGITKSLVEITDTTELTTLAAQAGLTDEVGTRTITDVIVGYTLTLSGFTENENPVKIVLPENTIRDTSSNGNAKKEILVGNVTWVETDVEPLEEGDAGYPKYTAFRDSIVDFVKPVITQKDVTLDTDTDEVHIKFTVTDTNFLESNILETEDLTIYVDNKLVYGAGADETTSIGVELNITNNNITDVNNRFIGYEYTLTLSELELSSFVGNEIFLRHSGNIKVIIAPEQVEDTSGNKSVETQLTTYADFIDPIIYYKSKYTNWEDRYALITVRATDRFYDYAESELEPSDLTLYKQNEAGEWINITNQFYDPENGVENLSISSVSNGYGEDFIIRLDDFEEEFVLRIDINSGVIYDTSDNYNKVNNIDNDPIIVALDNRRPYWKYVRLSTSVTDFDDVTTTGTIGIYVDGLDKYLDVENSVLTASDIRVILDQTDVTVPGNITVSRTGTDANYSVDGTNGELEDADGMRSVSYRIDVTGLTEAGTYTIVIDKDTLRDDYSNKSAATTISFSRSSISSNTTNYTMVTYHVSPDNENVHHSYVRELMSVNTTGTNLESTTYRPSSLGELNNNGENPLFAEPMYNTVVNGYTVSQVYAPKSFAGWAEADEDGNAIDDGTVYGLYDEIPNTVTNLKAVWQEATVVFVSNSAGSNSNDGTLPTKAVKDMETAFSKLNSDGTVENNIIVIMDAVEWNGATTIDKAATITSLYAGSDYETSQNAELNISSNMVTNNDIVFDNIKLYTDTNMLIANYASVTLGRRITTPSDKYTFADVIGGNYETETTIGEIGTHTVRVESGRYNNIIAGSSLTEATTEAKYVTHEVVIGNMKDAALAANDKLTITGSVKMGENEMKCYPYGSTGDTDAYNIVYSDVTLYSGTLTTGAYIHTRSLNGTTDGMAKFTMYGGEVNGNIYAGSRTTSRFATSIVNVMKFYGGEVVGDIYGQGNSEAFTGSSEITLAGCIDITGNVFGGANQESGTGNTNIIVNSVSATVNGNIYGASNGGSVTGATNITVKAGTLTNIYGSGNSGGNVGTTNITIENGTVSGNIVGGAYNEQVTQKANITVVGGIISGNIYGGNQNTTQEQLDADTTSQNAVINIGTTDATITTIPKINGIIYGSGIYDRMGTTEINLIESQNTTSVYGGSNENFATETATINLKGMTVNEIYGGGQNVGVVGDATINLNSGTATDVYGGGFNAEVTTSNVVLNGTAVATSIYGGSNTSGTVTTSNVTLTSGTVTNVFGGGNSASVGTANVTLNGITIDTIHGGSKDAGTTTTTNVTLTSGTVGTVFGGGLDSDVVTSNVTHKNTATVTTIYGGNNSSTGDGGTVETSNVNVANVTVENIYGGNNLNGTTTNTKINIQGTTTITGELYGGGNQSNIGTESTTGSTVINITGGTINGDINGGSKQGIVYGTTNIKIGKDVVNDATLINGTTEIKGNIYGAGSTTNNDYTTQSVIGNTNITMDNSSSCPIIFSGSIFGSGKGSTYSTSGTADDESTIHLTDFGTSADTYELISIERTGSLKIGNSNIEFFGRQDVNNYYQRKSYSLNRITKGLTVYNNTTIYTQRSFNMVGGFNSYKTISGTKATATITDGTLTTNVDNRLYTLEGINLIFAKQEGDIYQNASLDIWGDINGMAFFGMYALNRTTGAKQVDIYDPNYTSGAVEGFFKNGTYVEGRHKTSHNTSVDGFYTNVAEYGADSITVTPEIIEVTDYGKYYDWIIGAETVNYELGLIASNYGKDSVADVLLDYRYQPNTTYTVTGVSLNALNTNVELIDPSTISTISENANTAFGLTIETGSSGWVNSAITNIYTADSGSFEAYKGTTTYKSDNSSTPGTITFKVHNSINITETKDLGNVNIRLTAKTPDTADGTPGNTFIVVLAVNIQTLVDELEDKYEPIFTDRIETELNYTTDSRVDLTYTYYNNVSTTPYDSEDYRVLSTTTKLPAGTTLTLKDHGQGDNLNKVYYYHITDTTPVIEADGRFLYKLSNFFEMDSTTTKYQDSTTYYHSADGYVYEKYDLSIDFRNANISASQLAQETYLELRASDGSVKYGNGNTERIYNLHYNKNAIMTETISNEGNVYSVIETTEINFTLTASIQEQVTALGDTIMDTKYYDKTAGIVIEVLDASGGRVQLPDVQNVELINVDDNTEVYRPDENGVIRVPLFETLSSTTKNYKFTIAQNSVPPGRCSVNVYFFASDNGQHIGDETKVTKQFYATFVSKLLGLVGIEATEDSRVINKTTGEDLAGNSGIDMTVTLGTPSANTNLRIELYKRTPTYSTTEGVTTYTGTTYELVDIKDYLDGTWETPETYGLVANSSYEYMLWVPDAAAIEVEEEDIITINLERELKENISTGEYKIVIESYHDNILVQTARKTFIVTP